MHTFELRDFRLAAETRMKVLFFRNMVHHVNVRFRLTFPITYASVFQVGEYLIT